MKNQDFLTIINKGFVNAGRYFVAVASILTILASGFLIFSGVWEFVNGIPDILNFLFHHSEHRVELSVHFISAIDLFMVAVVMFVMGIGLFELFVDKDQSISYPHWLKIHDLTDLKEKLIAAVVVVIVITFFKTYCNMGKTLRNPIFWWLDSYRYHGNHTLFKVSGRR